MSPETKTITERAELMAQWAKTPNTKSDKLSLIPKTYMVEVLS